MPEKAIEETAKAVQELSKVTGKAIDAVSGSGRFLSGFMVDALTELSGTWADNFKYKRAINRLALHAKYEEKRAELGVDAQWRLVPMEVEVPLLEAASLTEDVTLQDCWVNLLLNFDNAKSDVAINHSFSSVLRDLSPLEVAILKTIYSLPEGNGAVLTSGLPAYAEREGALEKREPTHELPRHDVTLALVNLQRLGCLGLASSWDGGEIMTTVYQSIFGRAFVKACSTSTGQS